MQQYNFLSKLLEFGTTDLPFISVYLNTEPNETGKKDFEVFLKKQISDHAAVLAEGSPEAESFSADSKKIEDFTAALNTETRGAAIFACGGEDGFFRTFEFEVPFPENEFTVGRSPDIFSLVRLTELNPRFAVVAADTNQAHIYVVRRGKTVDQQDIENTKTNRSEVGGWSQMRYQRHIENFHQQHAKEVVGEMEKMLRDDRVERFVLVGDQAVIIPLLKAEFSKDLDEKIAGTLSMNVNTPEQELLSAAADQVNDFEKRQAEEKVAYVEEHNYDGGVGIFGVDATLKALLNGQVQELLIASDPQSINYSRTEVSDILAAYEPGEDSELPEASERREVVNEFLRRAAATADAIRFVDDPALLKARGGVGAVLRYQAKGVTNL